MGFGGALANWLYPFPPSKPGMPNCAKIGGMGGTIGGEKGVGVGLTLSCTVRLGPKIGHF